MGADTRKKPNDVLAKFKESLGTDISFQTARATLYSSFRQQKGETAAELDLRLSKLVEECKFPTAAIKDFLKRDTYINALNYYEVKKWAAKKKEELTYTKVMDKCKEYEATVRDYIAMANDNSQLQTAYQQGSASLDHNSFKKQKFTGRGIRNRSNSGLRECRPQNKPIGTKCKRCGFEHHTTTDGSCPALKSTCGFCKIVGHFESACIKKCTEKKREGTEKKGKQTYSPNRGKRAQTPGPGSRRAAVHTIRATDQLRHEFDCIHFDSSSTVYPTAPKVNIDTLTTMDTATDGKTYVLRDLDVKLPTRPERDTMRVKLDMGAEANILPVRTYNKMFPDRVLEDGTPDPKYLQPTHIEFECNKDSTIRSLGCITLDIAAPGKKLIKSDMFCIALVLYQNCSARAVECSNQNLVLHFAGINIPCLKTSQIEKLFLRKKCKVVTEDREDERVASRKRKKRQRKEICQRTHLSMKMNM